AANGDHRADHENAPRAFVEMRPRPNLRPGAAVDEVDPLAVEGIAPSLRTIDPRIAQNLAADVHAPPFAFLVVHCLPLSNSRPVTSASCRAAPASRSCGR